jgi:hypothetical protein
MASWNGIFHQSARGSRALGLGVVLALASVVIVAPGGCTLDLAGASAGGGGSATTSSTTSVAASTTTSASTTATTGTCGGAGCTPCVGDVDCGMPSNDGCTASICVGSFCTPKVTAGLLSTTQPAGDCMKSVCGADGKPMQEADPNDAPPDDMNVCTQELCVSGAPVKMPAAAGTVCPGGTCDGNGACLNCTKNADCTVGLNPTCDMAAHTCVSCSDGAMNGSETGIDCGGNCKACNGDGCKNNPECAGGLCVDSFCCNTACTGICQACDNPGSLGVCSSVAAGSTDPMTCADPMAMACDGAGACKIVAGKACTQDGECLGNTCLAGFCRAPTGSNCGDDLACASGLCSSGKCADCAAAAQCASMTCNAMICKAPGGAPCDGDMDCAVGKCQNNLCKLDLNAACTGSLECLSEYCNGGVCKSCGNNGDCPGSTCGAVPGLGFNACKLPKDAYCNTALPMGLGCNSGMCLGFPAKCK